MRHRLIQFCGCQSIMICPVRRRIFDMIVFAECAKLSGWKVCVNNFGNLKCINSHMIISVTKFFCFCLHKAEVELHIMSDQRILFAEFKELRQYFAAVPCSFYHIICNSGQLRNHRRYPGLRFNKTNKTVNNFSFPYFQCTNLNNLIVLRAKSSRLYVKCNI